jgi:hypothetical protein
MTAAPSCLISAFAVCGPILCIVAGRP